jgi:8-oxo-dGTP pyrophosphatase MutT (NUDIX family)
MTISKYSYGIALCRHNNEGVFETLTIKKRFTYYFYIFVLGKYKNNNIAYIKKLLDKMTYIEKIDILSLNFNILWHKIWLRCPDDENTHMFINNQEKFSDGKVKTIYWSKRKRYEDLMATNGALIKQMIIQSSNSDIIWELPKGKQSNNETTLETAIREFYEETNIHEKHYSICYKIPPIKYSFIDDGVNYVYTYYIAYLNKSYNFNENNIKFNYKDTIQVNETDQLRWFSKNHIKYIVFDKKNKEMLFNLFDNIKKAYYKSI